LLISESLPQHLVILSQYINKCLCVLW